MYYNKLSTTKIMLLSLAAATLASIPFYGWVYNEYWPVINGFPLGWIAVGMSYMATFFHEIGHTFFMWFYGYPTLPSFDFQHGGGMAWAMTDQQIPILLCVWAAMGYGVWKLKEYHRIQIVIAVFALLNFTLAFNDYHKIIINFMGPGFECTVAFFFLYRALFDLAPRGDLERFLNGFFGIGITFQVIINGFGLLTSKLHRHAYFQQKGSHGFGDFDKIADQLSWMNFEGIVVIWMIMALVSFTVPFFLYLKHITNRQQYD
jgi:hypothetical protein